MPRARIVDRCAYPASGKTIKYKFVSWNDNEKAISYGTGRDEKLLPISSSQERTKSVNPPSTLPSSVCPHAVLLGNPLGKRFSLFASARSVAKEEVDSQNTEDNQ